MISEPFGFMSSKIQCQICDKIVCKKCTKQLTLLPPSKDTVNACRRCHAVIKLSEQMKKLQDKSSSITTDELLQFHSDIKAAQRQIDSLLPKFQGLIYSLTSLFGDNADNIIKANIDDMRPFDAPFDAINELVNASLKLAPVLEAQFKKIEAVKGILKFAVEHPTPRFQTLLLSIKSHFIEYNQINLPSFRVSSARLRDILSHSKLKRVLEEGRIEQQERQDKAKYMSNMQPKLSASPHALLNSPKLSRTPETRSNSYNQSSPLETLPQGERYTNKESPREVRLSDGESKPIQRQDSYQKDKDGFTIPNKTSSKSIDIPMRKESKDQEKGSYDSNSNTPTKFQLNRKWGQS